MHREPDHISVDVLLFGPAAATADARSVAIHLERGTTARDALRALSEQYPALAETAKTGVLARNHVAAAPDDPIEAGDELALIVLVGGG